MGLKCRICASNSADAVNSDLVRGLPVRDVARKYAFSRSGTDRHARKCLPRALAAYQVPQQTLADQLAGLWAEAKRLQAQAEAGGDLRAALVALRQLVELLELKMRAMPPALQSGQQKQVQITVKYEEPIRREGLTDAQLVNELGLLVRRTKSEPVLVCCAKLACLLRRKPVPAEVEAIESKVLPQLSEGDNGETT